MEPLTRSALELDPMLAEAHAARGLLHALAKRWTEAEASFRHAIAIEPSYTSLHVDFVRSTLLPWGRVEESVSTLEAALETDPESLSLRRMLTRAQLNSGLYRQARDNVRRVREADPSFPFVDNHDRWSLLFSGERAEALASFETFSVGRPGVRGYIHAIMRSTAGAGRPRKSPRHSITCRSGRPRSMDCSVTRTARWKRSNASPR
jgi:tetratricopeptide (TPR) repeat protein